MNSILYTLYDNKYESMPHAILIYVGPDIHGCKPISVCFQVHELSIIIITIIIIIIINIICIIIIIFIIIIIIIIIIHRNGRIVKKYWERKKF